MIVGAVGLGGGVLLEALGNGNIELGQSLFQSPFRRRRSFFIPSYKGNISDSAWITYSMSSG